MILLRTLLLALIVGTPSSLCRYTVRDIAFVAFAGDRYTLEVVAPEGTAESWAATLRQIARASLADTDVKLSVKSKPIDGPPVATLRAVDGRTLDIPLPADEATLSKDGWDVLDAIGQSPARDEFKKHCLDAHAVVVVFEGETAAGNARVKRLAEEAAALAAPTLAELPKPAKAGPKVVVVPWSRRAAERVFHWAVGASEEETADAHVAVLYGRGRRMGPVLAGPLVTASEIKQALLLIGQDCECELPRSLMRGPMLPLAWTSDDSDRAQGVLGFDGRNPMVKQEIARIVARESTAPGAPQAVGIDPLGLGYHESAVDTNAPLNDATRPERQNDPSAERGRTPPDEDGPSPSGIAGGLSIASMAVMVVIGVLVVLVLARGRERP